MTALFIRSLVAIVALLLVTFFASMEAAFSTVDRLALSHLSFQKKDKAHLAYDLCENREQLLATILMGTNISVVLFTVSSTSLALEYSPFGIYTVPVTAILTVLLINVFGELIPKTRAAQSPIRYTLNGTRALGIVHRLMYPLSHALVALPKMLLSRSAVPEVDQIRHLVEYAEEQDTLPLTEKDMIIGVLDSGNTQVKEIMIPRVDMSAADIEDGIPGLLDIIRSSGVSRIPVFENSIDNIVGIIYAKDLLPYLYGTSSTTSMDIRQLLRSALFVPGSKSASKLLKDLQDSRTHIAIVIDEYGGVAGLVTIEDILEEIVGEIRDEYDQDEEFVGINPQPDGSLLIHGGVSLEDLSEALGQPFDQGTATTIAGLVLERLGSIPKNGDCIEVPEAGYVLCVERMLARRITLLRALKQNT